MTWRIFCTFRATVTSFTLVWIKMQLVPIPVIYGRVTSFTLVWIKMPVRLLSMPRNAVTSFTLVWIKIMSPPTKALQRASHELHARVD